MYQAVQLMKDIKLDEELVSMTGNSSRSYFQLRCFLLCNLYNMGIFYNCVSNIDVEMP